MSRQGTASDKIGYVNSPPEFLICSKCRKEKPPGEFAKYGRTCKECHNQRTREWRYKNPERWRQILASSRKRNPTPLQDLVAHQKTYSKSNRHKRWAADKISSAIRSGRIVKPTECSKCSNSTPSKQLHAHHPDYSKPLEIIWLCHPCHGLEHRIHDA
ncbi:hypothetical protein LCGC14_0485810 [marine sediment metagenome]|uniref:Uncharacterized protein n=1 Tax=marine sediment metagenome TaxID=412755 RepID=A0A0F9SDB5_9ZZZZ